MGDTVDLDDQDQRFTICNGEFFNNDLKLAHLYGDLNGDNGMNVLDVVFLVNIILKQTKMINTRQEDC